MAHHDRPSQPPLAASFGRTRWSIIATMRDEPANGEALTVLARQYWFPVYACVRRQGHEAPAAFALVAGFFAALAVRLRRDPPARERRFRHYLIERLQEYLAAGSRVSTDTVTAPFPQDELERRFAALGKVTHDPYAAFDRDYADELLAQALRRLGAEARQGGHTALFESLLPLLSVDPAPGQLDAIARASGGQPLAVATVLKRLRQRFRELIDEELARTVDDEAAPREERHALLAALTRSSP